MKQGGGESNSYGSGSGNGSGNGSIGRGTAHNISLFDLPPELFSNVLASFCDGKTISTFLMASQASKDFDAFDTVQGALVQRYEELADSVKDTNISETLAVLIQQIRTCERSSPERVKLFSERCAILDYFESQLVSGHHWLIWCGEFESFYGNIQACITSPYWSISALSSWYRDLELSQFSLVRPRVPIDRPSSYPFGSIMGRGRNDNLRMDRIRIKLEDNYEEDEYWKGMLTALHFAYEDSPSLVITAHTYPILEGQEQVHIPNWLPKARSMCCYWDDFEGYDDEALQNMGEHMIRLMNRFTATDEGETDSTRSVPFGDSWRKAVSEFEQPLNEFSYDEGSDDEDESDGSDGEEQEDGDNASSS